ncbi:hypothetical protein [Zhongshania aquimaris]|uniref:SatD family (SatD) n=1 Tax=Zhongshania aquimaris TaxID=2857107 RepID=A0ABS6VTU0_9GAMM|nr:hypothetical protein [Zhongshania aquimaris]MBW2941716.1 hypothetical protein [Zhongshania aquimaris]
MAMTAVITGDLINSRGSSDVKGFLSALKKLLAALAKRYGAGTDIFRGDGFQLLLDSPEEALECALALRAGLIAASPKGERWDARLAVGVAHTKKNAGGQVFSEAAVLSGQGLDSMKRQTLMVFSNSTQFLRYAELPTAFVAEIIDNWSVVEAQTYYLYLSKAQDQATIAKAMKKSRVTVTKALQRAKAQLLGRYLASVEFWLTEALHD